MEEFIPKMAAYAPIYMLVLVRTLALAIQAPYFGTQSVPIMIRVAIGLSLSFFYVLSHPNMQVEIPDSPFPFIMMLVQEFLTGVLFGYAANIVIAAIQVAGEIIDVQIGLSMVMLLNPQTKSQTTVMGKFFYQIAMIVLILSYAHLFFLKAFFETFEILPIGTFDYTSGLGIGALIGITTQIFRLGAQLAMPAIVVIFITDFGLGMMNRVAPQINILELNFALKPTVGALLVVIMFSTFISVMADFSHKMAVNARNAIGSVAQGVEKRSIKKNLKKRAEQELPPGFPQYIEIK